MKVHFLKDHEAQNSENIISDNNKLMADNKDFKFQIESLTNEKNKLLSNKTKMSFWIKVIIISNILTIITSITCFVYKTEIQEFIKLHISN